MIELGSIVKTIYGTGDEKEHVEVIGYVDQPTYIVVGAGGNQYSWVANLVRPCTQEESSAYWKSRAIAAESRLERNNSQPPSFTSPNGWTNQPSGRVPVLKGGLGCLADECEFWDCGGESECKNWRSCKIGRTI